ncbi:hypothetical protein U1Q18_026951 [Sarracenia purpurea var. burkii]
MASPSLLAILIVIFVVLVAAGSTPAGASKEFKVGAADGWRQPALNDTAMYNQWAARNRFHVGDSLRFLYHNDSVLVVDKWGYFHCNPSNPISTFKDGNSVVNLENAGPIYFISGDSDHCKNGQRLVIEVMALHSTSLSPPSIASPPQPYSAASPSPLPSPWVSLSATPAVSVTVVLVATFVTRALVF